jgi:predicted sugar kinase
LKSQMHTPRRMSAAPAATAMPIIAEVGSSLFDAGFCSGDVESRAPPEVVVSVGSDPFPPEDVRVVLAVPVVVAVFDAGAVISYPFSSQYRR